MHEFEWTISGVGTLLTAFVGNIHTRINRNTKKVNEHSVALGRIPAEVKVAVLEALATQEPKFTEIRNDIAEMKTDLGILKNRRTD